MPSAASRPSCYAAFVLVLGRRRRVRRRRRADGQRRGRAPQEPRSSRRRSRSASSPTSAASTTARSTSSANEGLERAKSELGVESRALTSKSNSDYVPNLSTLAQQKYDLVIGVGFLMAEAIEHRRQAVPGHELRDHRLRAGRPEVQARQRRGPAVQGERGGLPRRLHGRPVRQGQGRRPAISTVGGQKIPPVDAYIAGYQAGAKAANPDDQDAQRLLAGLRRPGEVQGARAQPDRGGLAGRLPGRRPLRPRRARRGEGEGRAGHRRRRRPGLPGRPHHDLGAEEGRRGRVRRPSKAVQDGSFKGGDGHDLRRQVRRRRARQDQRRRREVRRQVEEIRQQIIAARSPTSRPRSSSRTQ